jgi:hypothetical protein
VSTNPPRIQGNFSNGNVDTFDPAHHTIGVRLQQGVPLLDRDWNELEDTRRHFERMLRKYYIGNGAPGGLDGFKIDAPPSTSPNDLIIRAGRCMVDGYDLANDADLLYSTQAGVPPLPVPATATKYVVYLEVWTDTITSADDATLRNPQDINLETCIRDRLRWTVNVTPWPMLPSLRSRYILASIDRPAAAAAITQAMITDLRRVDLTLADVVDLGANLKPRVQSAEAAITDIHATLQDINRKLGRLFWDVDMRASQTSTTFGTSITVTANVSNYLGPVAGVRVEFSTSYGSVSPPSAVTDQNGQATATLVGVDAERPPDRNELSTLTGVANKINLATRADSTIFYSAVKFTPDEMGLVSKYSPASTFVGAEQELVNISQLPPSRTATVTCYAKEGAGSIVRGIGTVQISFAQWVRDWLRTKIFDISNEVQVGARIGAHFGTAWDANARTLNVDTVNKGFMDDFGAIADETHTKLVLHAFDDIPGTLDIGKSGVVGQTIAQGVTTQVGQKTNKAVTDQIISLQSQGLDQRTATTAMRTILQTSNQAQAGLAQGQKTAFLSGGLTLGG